MPTRQSNYGYGGGMGGRGYGGYGGSGLIAGQRAMWGTPVNYGLMFSMGYQTATVKDKAKTAELKLELEKREKEVADTIKQHSEFKTKGDKLDLIQEDNESLTKSLQIWKNEAFIIWNQIQKSDDPVEKAQLEAKKDAIESEIENAIGSYGYWDGQMDTFADTILSDNYSTSTNEDDRKKLAVYMNPDLSTREWKDGEMWITPKDGLYKPITGTELKELLPKEASFEAGDALNQGIEDLNKITTETGVETSDYSINRLIRNTFSLAKKNNPDLSMNDIAKSLMFDNDFIRGTGEYIGYDQSNRYNKIQEMWETIPGAEGKWVNATPEEMAKLKEKWDEAVDPETGQLNEELPETLDKEFANWMRSGIKTLLDSNTTFADKEQEIEAEKQKIKDQEANNAKLLAEVRANPDNYLRKLVISDGKIIETFVQKDTPPESTFNAKPNLIKVNNALDNNDPMGMQGLIRPATGHTLVVHNEGEGIFIIGEKSGTREGETIAKIDMNKLAKAKEIMFNIMTPPGQSAANYPDLEFLQPGITVDPTKVPLIGDVPPTVEELEDALKIVNEDIEKGGLNTTLINAQNELKKDIEITKKSNIKDERTIKIEERDNNTQLQVAQNVAKDFKAMRDNDFKNYKPDALFNPTRFGPMAPSGPYPRATMLEGDRGRTVVGGKLPWNADLKTLYNHAAKNAIYFIKRALEKASEGSDQRKAIEAILKNLEIR